MSFLFSLNKYHLIVYTPITFDGIKHKIKSVPNLSLFNQIWVHTFCFDMTPDDIVSFNHVLHKHFQLIWDLSICVRLPIYFGMEALYSRINVDEGIDTKLYSYYSPMKSIDYSLAEWSTNKCWFHNDIWSGFFVIFITIIISYLCEQTE